MTYVKINGTLYPATVVGRKSDKEWDDRETKSITLEADYATVSALFVDGADWSIVQQSEITSYQTDENGEYTLDDNGEPIQTGTEIRETEFDNSAFDVAGPITDHRNGTVTVKMGKATDGELLAILTGEVA